MFSLRKIDHLLLFFLIGGIFTFSAVFSKRASKSQANSLPQLVDDHAPSEIKKIIVSYRRCLLDQLYYPKETWTRIPSAIEECAIGKFWQSLDVHSVKIPTVNEHYYFIPPKPITSPCVAVRMNVHLLGGLVPEEALRRLMPQCEFFGAGQEDRDNFRSVGKFFKKISAITESPDQLWDIGGGRRVRVAADNYPMMVTPKTFLEKYVKRPRIDYLIIRGSLSVIITGQDGYPSFLPNSCFHEFDILRDPIDITVCQVSVHLSIFYFGDTGVDMMRYARPQFKTLFISLLWKSSFIPIRGEYIPVSKKKNAYLNIFYVNMSNPYCAKKYLAKCDGGECLDDELFDD